MGSEKPLSIISTGSKGLSTKTLSRYKRQLLLIKKRKELATIGMKNILEELPCRNKQAELLVHLLGQFDESPPASIFISGHKSSGKSYTVTHVLKHMNIEHAIISCIEAYTPSLLLDPILNQFIGGNAEIEADRPLIESRCEDMMDFVLQLNNKAVKDNDFRKQKLVVVLEEAEYLREMGSNILPAFLKLQELTLLKNICVILVTNLTWEKFCPPGGLSVPIQIYFPQYTFNELQRILLLDHPSTYPEDFYKYYLQLFMSVFWRSCRDLRELRYKAEVNFSKFCEPIENGKADLQDRKLLWQYIVPHFKASLEVIYLRTEMKEAQSEAKHASDETDSWEHLQPLSSSAKFALSFELPYYAKYLLIAAYLASYNSPKEDKKMFVKLSGRKKKQMPKQKKNSVAKLSLQVQGPRVFDMGRLLAIFYAIMEQKPRLSANLLSQISTLVELQLLQRIGDDALENPKFKCAVGLDFIVIIARTLSFSVTKYLADYK